MLNFWPRVEVYEWDRFLTLNIQKTRVGGLRNRSCYLGPTPQTVIEGSTTATLLEGRMLLVQVHYKYTSPGARTSTFLMQARM